MDTAAHRRLARELANPENSPFLAALRRVLMEGFEHTLIDSAVGFGSGARVAVSELADHLVIFDRADGADRRRLVEILESFLHSSQASRDGEANVSFVASAIHRPHSTGPDEEWPIRALGSGSLPEGYRLHVSHLAYEAELKDDSAELRRYREVVAEIVEALGAPAGVEAATVVPFPRGKIVDVLLEAGPEDQRIVAGLLEGCRNRELAERYAAQMVDRTLGRSSRLEPPQSGATASAGESALAKVAELLQRMDRSNQVHRRFADMRGGEMDTMVAAATAGT